MVLDTFMTELDFRLLRIFFFLSGLFFVLSHRSGGGGTGVNLEPGKKLLCLLKGGVP